MTASYPTDGYFRMLDTLRESGTMNMYGAPRWLQDEFQLERDKAIEIFELWTQDCERRRDEEEQLLQEQWGEELYNSYDADRDDAREDPQEYK